MSGCLSGMDGWENAVGRIGYFARQTTFIPAFVFFFIFLLLSFPGFDLLVGIFFVLFASLVDLGTQLCTHKRHGSARLSCFDFGEKQKKK